MCGLGEWWWLLGGGGGGGWWFSDLFDKEPIFFRGRYFSINFYKLTKNPNLTKKFFFFWRGGGGGGC